MDDLIQRARRVYQDGGPVWFLKQTISYLHNKIDIGIHRIFRQVFRWMLPKSSNIWVFTNRPGFTQNSKYLYLHVLNNHEDIRPIWISKERETVEELIQHGYEAYYAYSFEGIKSVSQAGFVFYTTDISDVGISSLIGGATTVNLWHGNPIKNFRLSSWYNSFKRSADYHVVTSSKSALDLFAEVPWTGPEDLFKEEQALVSGYPRNDILFKDLPGYDVGIDKRYLEDLQTRYADGTVFAYLPTWRDYEETNPMFESTNLERLDDFLATHDGFLVVKHHPIRRNPVGDSYDRVLTLPSNFDIYPVMNYFDVLITDYSSVYFGFLLLERPIILFPFDRSRFERQHGFQYDFDSLAGPKPETVDALIAWMLRCIDGEDDFKQERSRITNEFYDNPGWGASERLVDLLGF